MDDYILTFNFFNIKILNRAAWKADTDVSEEAGASLLKKQK